MWRLIYSIPVWIAFVFLVFIPLLLLGYIMVPIALLFKAYRYEHDEEKFNKGENPIVWHFTWPIMFAWDNWEDGIANETYFKEDSFFMQVIRWSCIRNPVNNLRIVPYLACKVNPKKIGFVGSKGSSYEIGLVRVANEIKNYRDKTPQWYFAWHGFYTCIFIQYNTKKGVKRFWLGWKIVPYDIYGISHTRIRGAAFAQQWKLV